MRLSDLPAADLASSAERPAIRLGAGGGLLASNDTAAVMAAMAAAADQADSAGQADADAEDLVPVDMQGDGPLVVREKFHAAAPMGIEQALFEMELVGHDFFLFRDAASDIPSVVYRRRGYQYGVIRLMEAPAPASAGEPGQPESGHEAGPANLGLVNLGLAALRLADQKAATRTLTASFAMRLQAGLAIRRAPPASRLPGLQPVPESERVLAQASRG